MMTQIYTNNDNVSREGYSELTVRTMDNGNVELILEQYTKKACNKRGSTQLTMILLNDDDKKRLIDAIS